MNFLAPYRQERIQLKTLWAHQNLCRFELIFYLILPGFEDLCRLCGSQVHVNLILQF